MPNGSMLEIHARAKAGLPDTWSAYHFECLPKYERPTQVIVLTGGIETKGKRGKSSWAKPHQSVYITPAEHEAFRAQWERETGLCSECQGAKEVAAGWNVETGVRKKACPKCKGTGAGHCKEDGDESRFDDKPIADAVAAFRARGYRRFETGLSQYAKGLFQRRLNRTDDKDDDVFVNFDYHAFAWRPDEPARHSFEGWMQVTAPSGSVVRIQTFTHTPNDIATRLAEIEAELIRIADAALVTHA